MDDIHKILEEFNSNKKQEILIAFDDMTGDMLNNKNLNTIVTELFIRERKLNISFLLLLLHNLILLFQEMID